jgi:hypothetical protein
MYIRLATQRIELDGDKFRSLVTPDRTLNEQCYLWEISAEMGA